jgi:hypothetical protein
MVSPRSSMTAKPYSCHAGEFGPKLGRPAATLVIQGCRRMDLRMRWASPNKSLRKLPLGAGGRPVLAVDPVDHQVIHLLFAADVAIQRRGALAEAPGQRLLEPWPAAAEQLAGAVRGGSRYSSAPGSISVPK